MLQYYNKSITGGAMLENYVDAEEAVDMLKVHPETVKRLLRKKVIPGVKVGNKWIIERERLLAFSGGYDRRRGRVRKLL